MNEITDDIIGKEVEVQWEDAVAYYRTDQNPDSLSPQTTRGVLFKFNDEYIALKEPNTEDYSPETHAGIKPENEPKDPSFLSIPKGMIVGFTVLK